MSKSISRFIERGDIYLADLSPTVGCEQGGVRPVLVIQNETVNQRSSTVIVACISGYVSSLAYSVCLGPDASLLGLRQNACVLLNQIRTIDKRRLATYLGHLEAKKMHKINNMLMSIVVPKQKK